MGPPVLRPDGTVFQAGATQYTAILGSDLKWSRGPGFPKDKNGTQLVMYDAPAGLLAGPTNGYGTPATFLELTPAPSNAFVPVPGVSYANALPTSGGEMLVLP